MGKNNLSISAQKWAGLQVKIGSLLSRHRQNLERLTDLKIQLSEARQYISSWNESEDPAVLKKRLILLTTILKRTA